MKKFDDDYLDNRCAKVIKSITDTRQAEMAQNYLHRIVFRLENRSNARYWFSKIKDLLLLKITEIYDKKAEEYRNIG